MSRYRALHLAGLGVIAWACAGAPVAPGPQPERVGHAVLPVRFAAPDSAVAIAQAQRHPALGCWRLTSAPLTRDATLRPDWRALAERIARAHLDSAAQLELSGAVRYQDRAYIALALHPGPGMHDESPGEWHDSWQPLPGADSVFIRWARRSWYEWFVIRARVAHDRLEGVGYSATDFTPGLASRQIAGVRIPCVTPRPAQSPDEG